MPALLWPRLILWGFIGAIIYADLKRQEVPYFSSLGFLVLLYFQNNYKGLFFGNLIVWLILFLLIKGLEKFYYHRPAFGGADFLLFFGTALYFNLLRYVLFLFLSFFLGLLAALILLACRKIDKDAVIPFAPFIMAAFVLIEYWGAPLLRFYESFYA
jgi:prepilin signal peptidase PulO-like enzyme (type II secretory pathway)